jgi:protein-S-isoprenylcysteine O-methyltransferase Ste14
MYGALMLAMAAFVVAEQCWLKLGMWFALALVLSAKASLEEQSMRERFREYESYQERTKRFVPGLWQ